MRRLTAPALIALVALVVWTLPAAAGILWCARDPIVRLNGAEVQIWVAIPQEYVYLVNGPIDVEINTPREVTQEIIFLDDGFNGYGETVTFGNSRGRVSPDGSFDTHIRVRVPINDDLAEPRLKEGDIPLQLTIVHGGVTETIAGTTDGAWVTTIVTSVSD